MGYGYSGGSDAGLQPDALEFRKMVVNLGNMFVRLAAAERRKVLSILEGVAFGKKTTVSYLDRWSKADMRTCYAQLQPISQKMANGWRRGASEYLKTGDNNCLAMKCLMDELVCRTWIEEP
jgi:hypothetical protein